uniref:Inhibitor I9 domain-containing protein n=1 Tax=Leersia perrieri TaxID=77586 RepID=A0A0D9X3L5_9ORYZ
MALAAKKKVSVVVVILLLFSAAAAAASLWFLHTRTRSSSRIYGIQKSTGWDDKGSTSTSTEKYQAYFVSHPNKDNVDARRRWYESFLPSTLTDSGEPRLLHCYSFHDVNGFLAILTRAEALALASKPGIRSMYFNQKYVVSSAATCGLKSQHQD